jgi:ParB family chromosome partitioning protein
MELLSVAIDDLIADPSQPRKVFPKEELKRLADSIAARGVLQPLRVLWDGEREKWRIITGESRWRAGRQAGLMHLPCLPVEGDLTEAEILSDQIIENAVRNALRPLELARAMVKLRALKGCSSQSLAKELGISGAEVSRTESLLSLPDDIQALVDDGRVPESIAYEISRHPDVLAQRELAAAVAARRMKRSDVTDAVRASVGKRNRHSDNSRLCCKLDGGVAITVSAGRSLTKADVEAAISRLRDEAKKLAVGKADLLRLNAEPSL